MALLNYRRGTRTPYRRIDGSRAARGLAILLCVMSLPLLQVRICHAGADAPSEYEVKAAFLYKFISFVEWPDESFPEDETPIQIGILGDDPFGAILDRMVKDKSINHRRLRVKRSNDPSELTDCHIVFIAKSDADNIKTLAPNFHNRHVLTVGDSPGFAERGGIINLIEQDGKVRFEINPEAAKRAHLHISSQLLALAKVVETKRDEDREKKPA